MKIKNLLILLVFLSLSYAKVMAQNTYDIVFPNTENDRDTNCQQCIQAFSKKPKEVKFSIKREGNNLYFQINDKKWFNNLFKGSGDGIAVDVVAKNRFDCEIESIESSQIMGKLLKPIYGSKLRNGLKPFGENGFRVHVGRISDTDINKELEYNILFLNNKNLCNYYFIYDLKSYPWDLLDMGVYLDSLTYNTKKITPESQEGFVIRNKKLRFKIPFKKNKSEYSQEDIKPIYDSLRLTDFNIKTIRIKAYASIEGSLKRNIVLQEQRANSIVAALQSFQKPTISTEVSSSENWVEFLNDIEGTKHENLKTLTKSEVKAKLTGELANALEPILKQHRKAVLEMELEKKDKYKNMSADVLLEKFNTAISSEKLKEALEIQNSIFEKLKSKEISPEFLIGMEIPKQAKFAKIFNKNSAIRYMLDIRKSLIVYNELLELEKLVPKDAEVKYNIMSIKMKLWRHRALEINEAKLKNQIAALKNYKIDKALILRMMVNFHIIKAENAMYKRDYVAKDKSVAFINSNYKKIDLSDYDYLSLAQFFSYYANLDMAVALLENKSRTIHIDEDLLFYYLNLTIVNKELTKDLNYRTILLNALNLNKGRFCKLFNAVEDGGVTFQLLNDVYLRKTYCESCKN
ncbi:hypothetical protein [uncultured Algibacter sp.]|uniref:hypothetical protein n=1 Tax=uncultured Algibacter sp. TaxID=298659 RepID=UPI0032172D27